MQGTGVQGLEVGHERLGQLNLGHVTFGHGVETGHVIFLHVCVVGFGQGVGEVIFGQGVEVGQGLHDADVGHF